MYAQPHLFGGPFWEAMCPGLSCAQVHTLSSLTHPTPLSCFLESLLNRAPQTQALLLGPLVKQVSELATWLPSQGVGQGSLCAHLSQGPCLSSFCPLNPEASIKF